VGPLKVPGPVAVLAPGPRAVDYLAGQQIIDGEATLAKLKIQAAFVTRRFRRAPLRAAIIAALAFASEARR
jgi:hypothetical protein